MSMPSRRPFRQESGGSAEGVRLPEAEEVPVTGDAGLIARIRAGDSTALRLLLEQFWRPLMAHASRILGSQDSAEDVVQETFVRVWERREQWQLDGSVRALLYQITHNLAVDEQRRRRVADRWIER